MQSAPGSAPVPTTNVAAGSTHRLVRTTHRRADAAATVPVERPRTRRLPANRKIWARFTPRPVRRRWREGIRVSVFLRKRRIIWQTASCDGSEIQGNSRFRNSSIFEVQRAQVIRYRQDRQARAAARTRSERLASSAAIGNLLQTPRSRRENAREADPVPRSKLGRNEVAGITGDGRSGAAGRPHDALMFETFCVTAGQKGIVRRLRGGEVGVCVVKLPARGELADLLNICSKRRQIRPVRRPIRISSGVPMNSAKTMRRSCGVQSSQEFHSSAWLGGIVRGRSAGGHMAAAAGVVGGS